MCVGTVAGLNGSVCAVCALCASVCASGAVGFCWTPGPFGVVSVSTCVGADAVHMALMRACARVASVTSWRGFAGRVACCTCWCSQEGLWLGVQAGGGVDGCVRGGCTHNSANSTLHISALQGVLHATPDESSSSTFPPVGISGDGCDGGGPSGRPRASRFVEGDAVLPRVGVGGACPPRAVV